MQSKFKIEYLPVKKVKLNPSNPRFIKDEAFKRLVKSLKDCPSLFDARPCVCSDRTGELIVLGGNMRYRAAMELGYKEVPVIIMSGLSEDQEREIAIKDNGDFGEWDFDMLANAWSDLPLADWGIDLPDEWLNTKTEDNRDSEPQIDRAEELNQKWGVKTGDLWQIGSHKLLCGDSTKKEDVGRVMGQEKADVCLTDPPYGIGDSKSEKNNYDQHDDSKENLLKIINGFLPIAQKIAPVVVLTPGNGNHRMYPPPLWTMAWFTPAGIGSGPWGFCCWQPILCYGKDPKLTKGKGRHPDAIVHTENSEKIGHPCSKPINFWSWLTERVSESGEVIYEPFAGSGTSFVACQNLNRKCRGIEISPNYCAVILERMITAFPEIDIRRAE
jgi:hypothetical protein